MTSSSHPLLILTGALSRELIFGNEEWGHWNKAEDEKDLYAYQRAALAKKGSVLLAYRHIYQATPKFGSSCPVSYTENATSTRRQPWGRGTWKRKTVMTL